MPDTTIKTEILIHDLKVPISVIDAGAKSLLNRQDTYGPLTEKQIKTPKDFTRLNDPRITTSMILKIVHGLCPNQPGVFQSAPLYKIIDWNCKDFKGKRNKCQIPPLKQRS